MPTYKAPVQDTVFLLKDVLKYERLNTLSGFSDLTPDVLEHILNEAATLCEEQLAPLNQIGDQQGCVRNENGTVTTPKGFKEAYDAFRAGGWLGLSVPEKFGGQGLPYTLASAINEFVSSSNMAFSLYPGLTRGAIQALLEVASDPYKQHFIPRMASGQWTGTMNLTEPHCGTDLGLIKTKAVDKGNGSYKITGQKIFISCGEHDMSENIIHLVLARVEGDPEGTKGISLFVVPKYDVSDMNGDPSTWPINNVTCGSLEHKMGIHGSSTCVMNYDNAIGYLVGERCKGLNAMFIMMNEARLGVAVQGLSQSELAYQNAVAYAKDRLQGRSLTGTKYPDRAADPIIVHPDIRRMLMDIKAINEAGRYLALSAAIDCDISTHSTNEEEKQAAEDRLSLLTPILKGMLTDYGFENAVKAQQIFGGHGYIREWGMEQFVRDARITQIYEGSNGIQALDLVGRKLPRNNGRAMMKFFKDAEADLEELRKHEALKSHTDAIDISLSDLKGATMWLMKNGAVNPDNAGSASYDYMHLFGLVLIGIAWGKISVAAIEKRDVEPDTADWMNSKLATAQYFIERILPTTSLLLRKITIGSATMMSLTPDQF